MTTISPIRYVSDVAATTSFYALLGLRRAWQAATSRTWASLAGDGGSLGLHIAERPRTDRDPDAIALHVTVDDDSLDRVRDRLIATG
ncbi:MAG: VOC family protein [Rubrivivax sp.]